MRRHRAAADGSLVSLDNRTPQSAMPAARAGEPAFWGDNTAAGWADFFNGDARPVGTLFKGGGGFSIDRPGDEENRSK